MASEIKAGTALRGPNGETAVRMGPLVTAYEFFVTHPDNGGHPVVTDTPEATAIESWKPLVPETTPAEQEAPTAPAVKA